MAVEFDKITDEIKKSSTDSFGSATSLVEADLAALLLQRARERHPSYYPVRLFTEILRSAPGVSLETMALVIGDDADIRFNLVPRSEDDEVVEWRGKFHGRGVMVRNAEIKSDGDIQGAWHRLFKDEGDANSILVNPFDLGVVALDTGGRGKEAGWIHVMQVNAGFKGGTDFSLDQLNDVDLIPHHRVIISEVLRRLPLSIGKGRRTTDFQFVNSQKSKDPRLSEEVARKLTQFSTEFKVNG